jgi:hypothetical protein
MKYDVGEFPQGIFQASHTTLCDDAVTQPHKYQRHFTQALVIGPRKL